MLAHFVIFIIGTVGFYFTNKVTSPMAHASFLLMLLSLAAKETKFAVKVRAIHFRDFNYYRLPHDHQEKKILNKK